MKAYMLLISMYYCSSSSSEVVLNGHTDSFSTDGRKTPNDHLTQKNETVKQVDNLLDKLRRGNDVSLKFITFLTLSYFKWFIEVMHYGLDYESL